METSAEIISADAAHTLEHAASQIENLLRFSADPEDPLSQLRKYAALASALELHRAAYDLAVYARRGAGQDTDPLRLAMHHAMARSAAPATVQAAMEQTMDAIWRAFTREPLPPTLQRALEKRDVDILKHLLNGVQFPEHPLARLRAQYQFLLAYNTLEQLSHQAAASIERSVEWASAVQQAAAAVQFNS